MKELEEAGIEYPETDAWRQEIPVYGIGETTVIKQKGVEPAIDKILDNPEKYRSDIIEMGHKAAAHNLKIDLCLENLAIINDEIGILDINDHEAIWTDEDLSFHLMGGHLLNNLNRIEQDQDIYVPELKEIAQKWKNIV